MSSDKKEEKAAAEVIVLSDAERLQLLEGQAKLGRILLFVILGLLGFALPIVLTIALVGGDSAEPVDYSKPIAALEAENKTLHEQLTTLEEKLKKQSEQLLAVQTSQVTQSVSSESGEKVVTRTDPVMIYQVAKALLGQEQDLQQTLLTQQTSMRDLANMVPGSRSWLQDYNEALNKLLAASKARVLELQRWAKSAGARPS